MPPDPNERPEISVVIPAYDERENLEPLLDELRVALGTTGRAWEAVVVDDASSEIACVAAVVAPRATAPPTPPIGSPQATELPA